MEPATLGLTVLIGSLASLTAFAGLMAWREWVHEQTTVHPQTTL